MCSQEKLKLVLDRVKEESKKIYGDKLDKIFLFGSYARGENTEESDIDIMIVLRCSREEAGSFRKKTYEMADDISIDEDVFLSIMLRDKDTFERNRSVLPFYRNVADDGVIIFG